jgi:4-amino-4-deoxy-L-arabinose transferase-like glycosyltransferase
MRPQRILIGATFGVVALLRFLTLALDPWEWDEVLFMQAVRDGLDVRLNHPHPPGYPVFVRAGQMFHALGFGPFRAATLVGAFGGILSVWALYLLLKELEFSPPFALLGAMLYALTPSVWLHGVRPLSDAPGAAMLLFAAVFLVRAIEGKPGANLLLGAVFCALAAGVRPQVGVALLPLAGLAALQVHRRKRRFATLATSLGAGVLLSAAIWVPAIHGSGGFSRWKDQIAWQMAYLSRYDSPHGADALRLDFWKRWFLDPAGGGVAAVLLLLIAAMGLVWVGKRRNILLLLFVPLAIATIALCPTDVAPRYALPFWPLFCALAAAAFEWVATRRAFLPVVAVSAVALLASFAALSVPSVVEVASVPSPSVAVVRAAGATGLGAPDIYVCPMLVVHAHEYIGTRISVVEDASPESIPTGSVFVCANEPPTERAPRLAFSYATPLLSIISRGRYVTSGLWEGHAPARRRVRFIDDRIPASVEVPPEGARVTSPVLARGWCQERGGGRVDPVEFRIDDAIYRFLPVTRVVRPEVTEAIPEIGDPRIAGWEVSLPALAPGRHVLRVTFQAGDRRRTYPDRSFVVEESVKR